MSDDVEQVFAEAVKATKGLKKLPYVDYAHRLHNKVRKSFQENNDLQDLQACVDRAPTYPEDDPDPDNWAIDIFGIGDLLTKLMIPSVANGIAGLESNDDPQNLRQYVDQNSSHLWYLQCITNLLGFCLVEHVNRDLKSRGALTIDDLWHNDDFKRSLMQFITNPEFIRTEVRTDVLRDDHLFSIVWLLIADYMSDRDHVCRNTPVAGSEFQNRPSYQALVQWSYTLWAEAGGKGDPDQMDSIVRFCGRVASFALCPLDATTGFQVPAQTFTVTKAFYEMSETGNGARAVADDMYNRELRESLQRLQDQEEIVNEWQSYCMALTHAWESEAVPLWEEGLYRAFKAKKWSSIQSWLHDACNKEGQYGLVGDNRPVRDEVCSIFNPLMVSGLLPGTPIALADGSSRPVEDIYSGDAILVPDHPGKSVVVRQNRLGRSPKTRLVGFNGQPPCMPASQVFQTTTGPRAVDVKGARCFNPYRNIGQLAVGHMLFRLEGHEWITVEIKSIDRGKVPRSELTHTLALAAEHQTYHAHGYVIDTNAPCHTLRETGERLRQVPEDQRLVLLSTCKELSFMFQRFDVQAISQRLNWELFGQYSSSKGNHPVPLKSIASLSFRDRVKLRKAIDVPKGVAIERLKRKFALDAHAPDRLPAGYELPTLTLVDGYLMVDDEVQLRSTYDPYHRSFRWTRELQQHNLFEHGVVEIYSEATAGRGAIYLSSESEPQRTLCRDQAHSFEAQARSLDPRFTRTRRADDDGSEWQALSEWQITYDRSIWPADEEERTEPQDPVDAGIIEDGWWASQGVNIPGVRLPALDDLRDQINQKYGQHLGELYQSVGKLYSSDETYESYDLYNVRWNRASLVPFVSNAGLDVQKTFDVGFPGLDIDVTIPALFQEMTLKLDDSDFLDEKITGYFFEYDPTKRGNKGNRHLVTGTLATSMAVQACRSKISQAYAPITKPGQTDTASERLQPARITETLLSSSALSIKDLVNLAGYNEKSVHNDTQTLIKEMMLYHMDSNQREKILQQPKPVLNKDIPVSLADDLPQKLKEFFKNKYAPAFISRYVGRTSKYMNSFTEKEMNNLWYWWQGNGKNSLSQSEEYNDINRLASREAMFRMNEEKLAPYRADNPDNWAEQLCTFLLNNPRQLRKWANFPIDDSGNNLINKQCNILDILSPSKDWAGQFFNQFMALILSDGLEYADIEQDGDQDAKYPWLHDSMHDLIVKVLNDDPSISDDVEAALREQIEEFEKQNNLNQQADAAQRAAAIVEKSASFMKELTGWLTYIGKGVQAAFGGTSLWKWVGEAFDRVASKVSLPGAAKLKGISTICMVGMTVAMVGVTIWTLAKSWNDMSDAQRTDVIIQVIRMVTDGLDKVAGALKSYISKPASTPADELNMETLGQNLTEEIMEHGETIGEVAEKIAGDEDCRVVMADGLHSEGVTTAPEGEETWNEDINAIAEDVPPSYEEAAKKFNWSGKLLRVFNAVLGLGLIVAMSFSLANDWNSLSDPGKVLGVLNVVVQGLTVLLDVIEVGSDIGLWAVTETMSVALPILGAVLAVVGIVLMVVQVFINLFTGSKQPPDPVADFIDDEAHALIGTFDTAPSPQLSYTISDLKVAAGQVKAITIKGENKSSDNVTISNTVITLYSGDDSVCLFRNGADETENIQLVDDSDPNHDSSGYTYVTPADTTAAQLPIPARLGNTSAYYEYDLQVAGPRATSTKLKELVVRSGEYIQSVWTAKINNKGDSDDSSVSWIEIVENGLKDRCQVQFALQRV